MRISRLGAVLAGLCAAMAHAQSPGLPPPATDSAGRGEPPLTAQTAPATAGTATTPPATMVPRGTQELVAQAVSGAPAEAVNPLPAAPAATSTGPAAPEVPPPPPAVPAPPPAAGPVVPPPTATAPPASAPASAPPIPPPASNLDRQVAGGPLTVVYPSNRELVEDIVSNAQELELTAAQVDRLKELRLKREEQTATPYLTPPKPVTRTVMVNLDPGANPEIVRLAAGQMSSLVFSDMAGQPWYIEDVKMNQALFNDGGSLQVGSTQAQQQKRLTNILSIQPLAPKAYGNVTVTLRGLSTPVIFILAAGQGEVDYRLDAKIPGANPDAAAGVAFSNLPGLDGALTYFLDGVPPKDARRLGVSGMDGVEAWRYRDALYVRVKADAQWPAYVSAARSTSGVSVYRYAEATSRLTFLLNGRAQTVFIN